jgi:hypothetical protein
MLARVDCDLERAAQAELDDGEKMLWMGQPNPARSAVMTLPIFIFAVPWTVFSVFWITMAWRGTMARAAGGSGTFFPLFGTPFLLIGLAMLSSPLWGYRSARGADNGR